MFKFVEFSPGIFRSKKGWPMVFYHRLANAGRLQLGPVCLSWPLPWHKAVRHLPGYGFERPSGVRSALGLKQRRASLSSSPEADQEPTP